MEGRTTEEIRRERPGWDIWKEGVEGGESLVHVSRRADNVIERVSAYRGDVLLFSHAHFLRVLAVRWMGLEPICARSLSLSPATVSVLGWERETRVLARWNDSPGDPLTI
jgi:probable phosphoglycerate mutase